MKLRATTAALLGAALCLGGAMPASAATDTEVIRGQFIELVSTADPQAMDSMRPGQPVAWSVSISADAPDPGLIDVSLAGTGNLALSVEVHSCDEPWVDGVCNASQVELRAGQVTLDGSGEHLTQFDSMDVRHLLLQVELADEAAGDDCSTELRVHAHGFGEDVATNPPDDDLPETGFKTSGAMLMLAGSLIMGIFGMKLLSRKSDARVQS